MTGAHPVTVAPLVLGEAEFGMLSLIHMQVHEIRVTCTFALV